MPFCTNHRCTQAKTSGEVGGCPFRRGSLFILVGWEARAKVQRIVTSSSSVRVGAAVPPKSGCLRYWSGACAIGRRVDACLSYVA